MDPILSIETREAVLDALGEAQRIGILGRQSLDGTVDHALGFVHQLPEGVRTVIDLGSGGGDPGLVIAASCPDLTLTLVDRRSKRTDLLTRLVGRLNLGSRVEVLEADVAHIPRIFPGRYWDAATCRGFGSPGYTAVHAAPLVPDGGCLLVSEPPGSDGSRWRDQMIVEAGFILENANFGVARMRKQGFLGD